MVRSLLLRKLDHMIPNPKRKMKECSPKCIDYPAEEILWDFLLHRESTKRKRSDYVSLCIV